MGFCKLVAVGNLGKDVELRTTPQGVSVAEFSMAVTTNKETQWFKVTVWRQLAENCAKYLKKGDPVLVDGTLSVETFQTRDGKSGFSLVITANDVQFLKSKGEDVKVEDTAVKSTLKDLQTTTKSSAKVSAKPPEDEIPF